jgi:hypothetical protein
MQGWGGVGGLNFDKNFLLVKSMNSGVFLHADSEYHDDFA